MIDFRSDTVTKPTIAMREAMVHAIVGDDVYQEDPTVIELEKLACHLTGKEAALFVPSGTMGNQIAIMTHTTRGDEIIIGARSHIHNYEVGAAAVLSGVSTKLIQETRGMMPLDAINDAIRSDDIHYPNTQLICLENAHGTGVVLPLKYMQDVYQLAKENALKVHLDGARMFNAAQALKVDVKDLCACADSVMFCLSKGLSAPIGSILVGSIEWIKKARKMRKLLGGGMRQVGMIAAAGIVSLNTMISRLEDDHLNAKYLAEKLKHVEGFTIDENALDINMVFVTVSGNVQAFIAFAKQEGFLLGSVRGNQLRLVCHYQITKDDIDAFILMCLNAKEKSVL